MSMEKLIADGFAVGYPERPEETKSIEAESCRYLVASTEVSDLETKKVLSGYGYVFHDRVLQLGIDIPASAWMRKEKYRRPAGMRTEKTDVFTDGMYRMACSVFRTDRRFHLDYEYDQKLADRVIKARMNQWEDRGLQVMQVFYKDEMTGFVITDPGRHGRTENVLGVTAPGIPGMASAYFLYSEMLDMIYEGGCRKYYGMVSTENTASVNLHIRLGAEVCGIVDRYILRK